MGTIAVLLQIVNSLLPFVKAGTQAYHDIKEVTDSIKAAHAAGRVLTDDEVNAFLAKALAAGDQLEALGAVAEAELNSPTVSGA